MAKRKRNVAKKVPKKIAKQHDFVGRLRKALSKRKKDELIDALVKLAQGDRRIQRSLETRFDLERPCEELVVATRQAITDATDFDERDVNYNFDYDYRAYVEVKRNLSVLLDLKQWTTVMDLSLELMRTGSYQVEMSDEGMMTEDIEASLQVVIKALKRSDLPASDVTRWCAEMSQADRVGFICEQELQALRRHIESTSR